MSCDPSVDSQPDDERAIRDEFSRIDRVARTICIEGDEATQIYRGTVADVLKAFDGAFSRAVEVDGVLEHLRDARMTPQLAVASFARAGSLYDCIWNSLRRTEPVYTTEWQDALILKLQATIQALGTAGRLPQLKIQADMDNVKEQPRRAWRLVLDQHLKRVAAEMVRCYVLATLFARRYALSDSTLSRIRERLPIVSSALGEQTMRDLLKEVPDPTDPTGLRRVRFATGMVP
jgi:hypothetical protein